MRYMTPKTQNNAWDFMNEMDSIFEQFLSPRGVARASQWTRFTPAVDIEEHEDCYLLSFDVPGVKKDDISIEVKDRRLIVSGERKFENRKESDGFRSYERGRGHFERSFQLPENVNHDSVEAHYEEGVLEIMIPKKGEKSSRSIPIGSGKGKSFFSKLVGNNGQEEKEKH